MIDNLVSRFVAFVVGLYQSIMAIYFDKFRYAEFSAFVTMTYALFFNGLVSAQLPPAVAKQLASIGTGAVAIAYIRNPKKRSWEQGASTDPAAAVAVIEGDKTNG